MFNSDAGLRMSMLISQRLFSKKKDFVLKKRTNRSRTRFSFMFRENGTFCSAWLLFILKENDL